MSQDAGRFDEVSDYQVDNVDRWRSTMPELSVETWLR